MKSAIPIYVAVEDDLSETLLLRVLRERPVDYLIHLVFKRGGFGYLKKKTPDFNKLAKACPVLMLTDLDRCPCAPELIGDWLGHPKHPDFLLRVAVREVEAWLLASSQALGDYLGLRKPPSFPNPESLPDPKLELLRLCETSKRRELREATVRRTADGKFIQGPAYNSTMGKFVADHWDLPAAAKACPSLARMLNALTVLEAAKRGS